MGPGVFRGLVDLVCPFHSVSISHIDSNGLSNRNSDNTERHFECYFPKSARKKFKRNYSS